MPDLCEAHLERTGKEVPAYKLGLCEDCFKGRAIGQVKPPKDTIIRPADCGRCGKPRHRGGCGGEQRWVDPLKIEHATALLTQGKSVGFVVAITKIPRSTVEGLKGFLGM